MFQGISGRNHGFVSAQSQNTKLTSSNPDNFKIKDKSVSLTLNPKPK